MAHTPIPISDLTTANPAGAGFFDTLMRAQKAHLDVEFEKNRIRGPEYATVYLGSLQATLEAAMNFIVQRHKLGLEIDLQEQQLLIGAAQLEKAQAEVLQVQAQTQLINQQRLNAVVENTVLIARECLLRAEYDVMMLNRLKVTAETELLNQKRTTETAQTSNTGVDPTSILGRQNALYLAQSTGFTRDAEQKAAKLLVDSWNVRRTTDEGVTANTTNQLDDASIGRAVAKLLTGIAA